MTSLGDTDSAIATRLRKEAPTVQYHSSDEMIDIAIDHEF